MKYTFTIPGAPVGKQRPRIFTPKGGKFPIATTPTKTRNYEALIKMCATEAGVQIMPYCKILVEVFLPMRLKTFKTKPNMYYEPRQRPDIDNIVKSIKDALEKIAFTNDKNVLQIEANFVFTKKEQPETKVHLVEVYWEDYVEIDS